MRYIGLIFSLLVVADATHAGASPKKTFIQEATVVAPAEYAELVAGSELIARVRVSRATVRASTKTDALLPPIVFTEYSADILEVYGGRVRPGVKHLKFLQHAGELEEADRIIRVDTEPLPANADYIVFLRYVPRLGAYTLVGEREAVFKVTPAGVVVPQGTSTIAEQRQNMRVDRFVGELQRQIGRTPTKREHQ